MAGAFPSKGKTCFSHLSMRYVRPFVRNNNYSVCNCNRIGGFARDDSLPQHLAAASLVSHSNLANNLFASSCVSRRPARLFFRPKCDVTVSNWSDEREGQNEQVPAYSMRIRTAFVVCIRRGEITGAASRGKQPDARRRRCSEDGTHPCRRFWNKPADLLFLRSPPRLLRQRYQYPCYQATGTWHSRDCGCNRLPQLRKGKHPLGAISIRFEASKLNYKSAEKYAGSDTFELLVLFP